MLLDDDHLGFDGIGDIVCNGCEKTSESCRCQSLVSAFNKTNQYLAELNLLDQLAGDTLTLLIQERITTHVHDTCKGIFDVSHIKGLEKWLKTIVLNWLTRIYNHGSLEISKTDKKTQDGVQVFQVKLTYFLYETYAKTIIEQFFNIIIGKL